jgi:DNA-binding winged helix-turn-helix (wHTH) protein/tetratricopeptide (TPR) repeat protein
MMADQDSDPVLDPRPKNNDARVIAFGPFRLFPALRRLERDGQTVRLGGRALELLIALAKQPGQVVTKAELAEAGWPGMVIEETALRFHISVLRKALGDGANESVITTVPGRGYCFTAPQTQPPAGAARLEGIRTRDQAGQILVGRTAAQGELARLMNRAAEGEAQIVFLSGEPGIGKSALTAAFLPRGAATGATSVVGHCLPSCAETDAYHSVLEILPQLAAVHDGDGFAELVAGIAPAWAIQAPILAEAVSADRRRDAFGATHHRMCRELCALLETLTKDRLVVLVIEDLHWMDEAGLDLLRDIAHRRLKSKLLILATLRTSDSAATSRPAFLLSQSLVLYRLATEVRLANLTREDVAEYLRRLAGREPTSELATHLHARSGGNPLFMSAMVEHWAHEGLVTATPEGWSFPPEDGALTLKPPPSLTAIIEDEIDRRTPDERLVIYAASASEGVFSAAVNHAATPLDEETFEAICEDLARSPTCIERSGALTLPNGRLVQGYAFHHMLIRDVAYDRQGRMQRAASHAAIGARIEQLSQADPAPVAGKLAHHFLEAENWARAVSYLRVAARVDLGRFSPREAAHALEQALAAAAHLSPEDRPQMAVEIKAELAAIYAGSLDPRAPALYDQVLAEAASAGRPDIQCRVLLGQGVALSASDLNGSRARFEEAIARSEVLPDPVERAHIRSHAHAWCSWAVGWDPSHAAGCEAAIEVLRREGDPLTLKLGLANYHLVLLSSSRYREAYEAIIAGLEALEANASDSLLDLPMAHWYLRASAPVCLLYDGRLGSAFEAFGANVQTMLGNGDLGRAATLQLYEVLAHMLVQDFAGAAAVEYSPDNRPAVVTENQIELAVRGLAAWAQGRVDEAISWFERARAVALRRPTVVSWLWRLVIAWGMTDVRLAAGEIGAAQAHVDEFRELAYATQERTWRAMACEASARVALASRDLSTAEARVREGWQETDLGPLPLVEWRLHAVEAAVRSAAGDPDGAAGHRQACAGALAALAQTLPEGHSAREALNSMRPAFVS